MKLDKGQYYGTVFQTRDIDGIILTQSRYQEKTSLPLHYHENPYFSIVLDGFYREHSLKSDLTCSKGDIVFHPSKIEHYNHFTIPASCFNIEFSDKWIEKIFSSNLTLTHIESSGKFDIQRIATKVLMEFNQFDSLSPLMIEGLVTEMLVVFSRSKNKSAYEPHHIKKIAAYIEERYYTNPSLSELSNLVQMSPEYIVRSFKKMKGITIGEYTRHIKVHRACEKLKQENANILDTALEYGFSDQSHFTKTFKKVIGITPKQYQKINRQSNTKISKPY